MTSYSYAEGKKHHGTNEEKYKSITYKNEFQGDYFDNYMYYISIYF